MQRKEIYHSVLMKFGILKERVIKERGMSTIVQDSMTPEVACLVTRNRYSLEFP